MGRRPTSPAELLTKTVLPATGLTKNEIADALGITRQTLHNVLTEKTPVTPQMAVRLGKLFGNGPELWHRMQSAVDLWYAIGTTDVSNIRTLKGAPFALKNENQ